MPGSPTKSPKEVRIRWYLQVERYGRSIAEVCVIFGISRKKYYKWYRRDHGLMSGRYHSRRSHPHTKLTSEIRAKDSLTRLQYAIDLPDKTARSAVLGFELACLSFPFAVEGVQTDNGGEFRGDFARYLAGRGVAHRFIPKRSAPWNGKVERANRSVDDEYYLNPHRPWKTLEESPTGSITNATMKEQV